MSSQDKYWSCCPNIDQISSQEIDPRLTNCRWNLFKENSRFGRDQSVAQRHVQSLTDSNATRLLWRRFCGVSGEDGPRDKDPFEREKKLDSRAALTGPWLCVVTWETIAGEMDTCSGVQMVTLWFGSLLRVSQLTESDNHDRRTHDLAWQCSSQPLQLHNHCILQCHTTNATHTTTVQQSVLTSTTSLDVTAEIPLTVLHNHFNYTKSQNWCNSKVLQHSTLSSTSTLFDIEDSSFRENFGLNLCLY